MKTVDQIMTIGEYVAFREKLSALPDDTICFIRLTESAVMLGSRAREDTLNRQFCVENNIPVVVIKSRPDFSATFHTRDSFRFLGVARTHLAPLANRSVVSAYDKHDMLILGDLISATLDKCGAKTRCAGNNVLVAGKKVGSYHSFPDGAFSGAINLKWDVGKAEKAINSFKHDMRNHISSLDELGYKITYDQLKTAMISAFSEAGK